MQPRRSNIPKDRGTLKIWFDCQIAATEKKGLFSKTIEWPSRASYKFFISSPPTFQAIQIHSGSLTITNHEIDKAAWTGYDIKGPLKTYLMDDYDIQSLNQALIQYLQSLEQQGWDVANKIESLYYGRERYQLEVELFNIVVHEKSTIFVHEYRPIRHIPSGIISMGEVEIYRW